MVGLGPGNADLLCPRAAAALAACRHLVGYGGYLQQLDLAADKTIHASALGAEVERARRALELAAAGHRVALVSSGDPGIYAMGAVVLEQIDRALADDERHPWGLVPLELVPGVSAMQAAAAAGGALLGHDFCAISLSDLLTAWEQIERRIRCAAEGDFVVAFYNPVSRRRRWQIERARDLLLAARPADTPTLVGHNLERPGGSHSIIRLADLCAARLDMFSLVLVGASTSRLVRCGSASRAYTPRGYAGSGAGAGGGGL